MPEVGLMAVNAWSITNFNCKLDVYGFWLTDDQAAEVAENPGSSLYDVLHIVSVLGKHLCAGILSLYIVANSVSWRFSVFGYIIHRALYYCSGMLSSKHEPLKYPKTQDLDRTSL